MKIGFAQINPIVGDFAGNAEKIADSYRRLVSMGAEVVVTPELAITGYPPQDLLFKSRFVPDNMEAVDRLACSTTDVPLVVGFVDLNAGSSGRPFHNAAAVLARGEKISVTHKVRLPTYDVFDEARYFEPGRSISPVTLAGKSVGVTICEDIWDHLPRPLYQHDPVSELCSAGAKVILNLSASPFQLGKPARREAMIARLAAANNIHIAYCNAVGGNDQLLFDGHSLVAAPSGVIWTGASFREENAVVDFNAPPSVAPAREETEDLRDALVMGLRDYMAKCGFQSAVLGLSGGIDSAVTACLAVEAVGADNVTGVLMPSRFSSRHSIDDALALAANLGIRTWTLPIHSGFDAMVSTLAGPFAGLAADTTEENIQARLRGVTLMALSNKFGSLLLTTGNKSELAVGYCTLYGDMCGGLAVISDVPKTLVYTLAEFLNAGSERIPRNTIAKPPSAELRPDQTDQDTLPPYDVLDEILRLYVEENLSRHDITLKGFDPSTVDWIVRRVDLNEYKRNQAAPGLKVTGRAFGIGRRMPIAQHFVS